MAGTLVIDTLKASSGVLATQNGMTGIAKAWVNYNGSTQTITNSFNVSSVTYTGAGVYRVNYTTALSANSCPVMCCSDDNATNRAVNLQGTNSANNLTTSCTVSIWKSAGGGTDATGVYVAVLGS